MKMFGAIAGDVAGSTYEFSTEEKPTEKSCKLFAPGSRCTDDTVLTLAMAHHFLSGEPYTACYQNFAQKYLSAGYGPMFLGWMGSDNPQPYNSCGNGSAMRASHIAWVAESLEWALKEAEKVQR
mmetsp:Transcript_23450/g.38810  ORF Transcript_23450/g.38810 Transcript_23450/m.38810 type:complete len:124 (-) Transcript_23450:500-871(-)